MNAKYSGRLELTWTNKDKRLLAHDDISYEWVSPTDYRVSEVRLLRDAGTIGLTEVDARRSADNLLIQGDALHALTSLVSLPEFADAYAGKIKLVYIDPPFNTGQTFSQYDDNLEHSVWLTMMRDRLLQIRDLLSPDGTVWLHLDDTEVHRARMVMDETLGIAAYIGTIIWQKADTVRNDAKRFSTSHDYILVYGSPDWVANRLPRTEEMNRVYRNPDNDPRGLWLAGTLISPSYRASGDFEVITPSGTVHQPPKGTSWRVPKATFNELLADNRIWFGKEGSATPQRKIFLSEAKDRVVDTIWDVKEVGGNRQSKAEIKKLFPNIAPFETPKPERLMERIIHIGTDPGDVVLDCFGGSGTTAAVAHKMSRRWVMVEWSEDTLRDFLMPRLTKVVNAEDPGGITDAVGWEGGGGFRILDVAPSMFEADEGMVFLAEWATDSALGETTAAQLRFEYEPLSPFCGRKGRQRLAVLDGIATPEILDLLVSSLGDGEKLVLCATAIAPDAREHLKAISSGSRLRKIPASILAEYRVAYRAQRRRELNLEAGDAEAIEQIPEPATG